MQKWIFSHFWNSKKCVFVLFKMSKNVFLYLWKCQKMQVFFPAKMGFIWNFNSLCSAMVVLLADELIRCIPLLLEMVEIGISCWLQGDCPLIDLGAPAAGVVEACPPDFAPEMIRLYFKFIFWPFWVKSSLKFHEKVKLEK